MSTAARKRFITPEEYLAIDSAADFRSEYYHGQMVAMSGASLEHNRIVGELFGELRDQLRGGPCEAFTNDLRVGLNKSVYTYPDIVIVCGDPELLPGQFTTLMNPLIIIEVLSPTTQSKDRGSKFAEYRLIRSLQHYVLIRQDIPAVERHDRQPDKTWTRSEIAWPDGIWTIASIGIAIPLRDIYARVFPPDRPA